MIGAWICCYRITRLSLTNRHVVLINRSQVTFLPLLNEPCSFDLLVYTNKAAKVPKKWEDSDPRYIMNSQEVKLRSFTTSVSLVSCRRCCAMNSFFLCLLLHPYWRQSRFRFLLFRLTDSQSGFNGYLQGGRRMGFVNWRNGKTGRDKRQRGFT